MTALSIFRPDGSTRRVVAALVRRDFALRRSHRFALGFDVFLGVLNVLVYYFISRTFAAPSAEHLAGAPSYFAFAVVGIAVSTVITAAATEVGQNLREEQLTNTLEALLIQPVTPAQIGVGLATLPVLFAVFRGIMYGLVSVLFLGLTLSDASWAGVALTVCATSVALSALGLSCAAFVIVVKRGQVIAAVAVFLLGVVGGAVFPIAVLPGWLQPLARIVPTRFAFDGVRKALFLGSGWGGDVAALAVFAAVWLPIALWLLNRAVWFATRNGSLAQY